MAKRIKEVNGIKVVKRYCAGSIFSGLLCFLYPAIAIMLLVLPWEIIDYSGYSGSIQVSIIETIKSVVGGDTVYNNNFISPITSLTEPYYFFVEQNPTSFNPTLVWILKIFDICAMVAWICLAILAVCLLFYALLYLFRGKVVRYKIPFILSLFASLNITELGVIALVEYIMYSLVFKIPGKTINVSVYWLIAYVALAILGTILLAVIFNTSFKNRVFIGDLGDLSHLTGDAELDENCRIRYVTKEVVKVKYEPAIGLPPHLSSIGGHAFSQNMNLVVAMIPNGIKSIGQGAFANCGRLKVVSIPVSVKSIGFNCFFNCVSLQRINYAGTKEQWRHIRRGSNWLTKAGTYTVVCADGAIIVNPYH